MSKEQIHPSELIAMWLDECEKDPSFREKARILAEKLSQYLGNDDEL